MEKKMEGRNKRVLKLIKGSDVQFFTSCKASGGRKGGKNDRAGFRKWGDNEKLIRKTHLGKSLEAGEKPEKEGRGTE